MGPSFTLFLRLDFLLELINRTLIYFNEANLIYICAALLQIMKLYLLDQLPFLMVFWLVAEKHLSHSHLNLGPSLH